MSARNHLLHYPNETPATLRRAILEYRRLRPPTRVVRHIGRWELDHDGYTCEARDCCQRRLCGADFFKPCAFDPRTTTITWHIELVLRFPDAFADEPFCPDCGRVLAGMRPRTREEWTASEQVGPQGNTLSFTPTRARKTREFTWDEVRAAWPLLECP